MSSTEHAAIEDGAERPHARNHKARTGRLDKLSNGLCSSDDFLSIRTHMASFMAAGFDAIRQTSKASGDTA
ncbi:hypothetical protein [Caulobacter segnis]|uniref:hypothetical protein n=1 Tax=Caulobacter segnis TaxID=88688 RepID=UPI0001BC145E|nr:hypothetical protein [Caulobacter segnis]